MAGVWYLAYGSNLDPRRFGCYLAGGRAEGGRRAYPGARDSTAPQDTAAVTAPGSLVFAGTSRQWGGGIAFLRPDEGSRVMGRAYLVEAAQLGDVVAQEVRREPGSEVATRVEAAVTTMDEGERVHVAEGQYDAVVRLGSRGDVPLVAITRARTADLPLRRPAPAYLWWIASGLRTTFDWPDDRIVEYLARAPGCAGEWSPERVAAIVGAPTATAAGPAVTDPSRPPSQRGNPTHDWAESEPPLPLRSDPD
jgi:hypothetical protein